MSGFLSRLRQRPAPGEPPTSSGDPPESPDASLDQPTEVVPAVEGPGVQANPGEPPAPPSSAGDASPADPTEPVPAGAEPVAGKLSFRDRGRLRRRLRFLRRVRELGFRDLGGLVFDQHRFGRPNPQLVGGKLAALQAVDAELRAIEHALGEERPITELREPGITACVRCGAVHGSEARFCPSCGIALRGARAVAEVGDAVRPLGVPGEPPPQPPSGVPAWAAPADPTTPPGPR